jgi:hypothetical protein
MTSRQLFDLCIGQSDRCLSQLIGYATTMGGIMDDGNRQTLKHHAEDMQGAAGKILRLLGVVKEESESPTSTGREEETEKLVRILREWKDGGKPMPQDVATHAMLLVGNGRGAVDALEESRRTLDEAEQEGGM